MEKLVAAGAAAHQDRAVGHDDDGNRSDIGMALENAGRESLGRERLQNGGELGAPRRRLRRGNGFLRLGEERVGHRRRRRGRRRGRRDVLRRCLRNRRDCTRSAPEPFAGATTPEGGCSMLPALSDASARNT